ncbi:MAG: 50S ribosomal protein L25 [Firmicutes bacterium]|nr:50S ribosomal protein L25 [Bacillota bacterium]
MAELTLPIEPRVPGHPNRDRREGYVPAVVYAHGQPAEAVRVPEKRLREVFGAGGEHHVIRLVEEGGPARAAIVKEVQRDPVHGKVLHVDFQAVSLTERIRAEVPVVVVGEEALEKAGWILQHQLHAVEVECLPGDLPDHIEVDVSGRHPGEAVHVRDMAVPPGVTVLEDEDAVVAAVLAPRTAEEPEEGGEAPEEGEARTDAEKPGDGD